MENNKDMGIKDPPESWIIRTIRRTHLNTIGVIIGTIIFALITTLLIVFGGAGFLGAHAAVIIYAAVIVWILVAEAIYIFGQVDNQIFHKIETTHKLQSWFKDKALSLLLALTLLLLTSLALGITGVFIYAIYAFIVFVALVYWTPFITTSATAGLVALYFYANARIAEARWHKKQKELQDKEFSKENVIGERIENVEVK